MLLIDICFGVLGLKMKTFNITVYNMSEELFMPPIVSFYAKAMIQCFKRGKESFCIFFSFSQKYTNHITLFMDEANHLD